MASTGDAALGEAEAGSTKKSRRRISDYLGDSDGGEVDASPRLRLPRFTCARFRFVRLGRKRGGQKEVAAAVRSEDASVDNSGTKQAETSATSASTAEAGIGVSMLLLLARTCVELNRMAEVRAQMETLLNEIRDEAGRVKASADHVVGTPGTCCNLQPPSSTTVSSSCTSDTDTNRHATDTEIARARRKGESEAAEDGELEAELETEHAQHRLLEGSNTEHETSESSDDEFIELDGGRFGGGGLEWDVGDEDSEEEKSTGSPEQDGGVCAIELERRLHELLHRRNRERIEELESALRRADQKLMEKEMEARMWQETVTLALQQPPPPPPAGSDGQ